MSNNNIYSAEEAFMHVFCHLITACCCQIKVFANEQQQHSQVIQTDCYLSALQKSSYPSGHSTENVLPLTLNFTRADTEQSIRVCILAFLHP